MDVGPDEAETAGEGAEDIPLIITDHPMPKLCLSSPNRIPL